MSDPTPDVALLAALDAGLVEPARAARLQAQAQADPRAAAVLAALAATRRELADLPDPPIPPAAAGRWAAALDDVARRDSSRHVRNRRNGAASPARRRRDRDAGDPEAHVRPPATSGTPPIADPAPCPGSTSPPPRRTSAPPRAGQRPGRARPIPHRPGRALVLIATLATVATVVLALLVAGPGDGAPSVTRVELASFAGSTIGLTDLGDLADATRRAGCLAAIGPTGARQDDALLGGRRVRLDGQPAVLLVLSTGTLGRFRLLVVDPQCGPDGGTLFAELVAGR